MIFNPVLDDLFFWKVLFGFTDSCKTAKNLTVRRKNLQILTVIRKKINRKEIFLVITLE